MHISRSSSEPFLLGRTRLKNRYVMTPHLGRLPTERLLDYLASRFEGGAGMAIVPCGQLVYSHSLYPDWMKRPIGTSVFDLDEVAAPLDESAAGAARIDALRAHCEALAELGKAHGVPVVGQLHHPGAEQSWDSFEPLAAPSPVVADDTSRTPHALTTQEIEELVGVYVRSAHTIVSSGLSGVEIHAAHGYLLNRFLSSRHNRRSDSYGGTLTKRTRLVRDILAGIREAVGPDPLLGIRLPAPEDVPGGLTTDEITAIAKELEPYLSWVNLSLGNHDGMRDSSPATAYTTPWLDEAGLVTGIGHSLRAVTDLPILLTGRVTRPEQADELIGSGAADLVGMARAWIAEPRFAALATTGRDGEIRPCIQCNECTGVPMSCPSNPAAGRERTFSSGPSATRKRVVVVGAGPAGTSCALRAAERGHRVMLLDAGQEPGGMLKQLLQLDALSRWHPLLEDVSRQLRSSTVNAIFGSPVTAEECLALDPDAVVVATGGRPSAPSADGYGSWHTDLDVLTGRYSPDPAAHVVVACGTETHQGPLAIADHLAQRVSKVTLLTELRAVGQSVEPRSLNRWLERLTRSGVKVVPMQRVTQLTGKTVLTSHTYGGPAGAFLADDVIWAGPRVADDSLAASLARERPALPLVVLGDALAPRRITHAVLEGARAGRAL